MKRVEGADNFDLSFLLQFGEDRALSTNVDDRLTHVLGDDLFHEVIVFRAAFFAGEASDGVNGRLNPFEQAGEISHFNPIAGPFDGPATFVAEDHDEFGTGDFGGEFHGTELIITGDVAGDAAYEDITDPLVEYLLDGDARVQAGQDDGFWELAMGGGLDAVRDIRIAESTCDEALVSLEEILEDRIGREPGLFFGGYG